MGEALAEVVPWNRSTSDEPEEREERQKNADS
jgi:hypothetical protein